MAKSPRKTFLCIAIALCLAAMQPPPSEQFRTFPAHWTVEESRPVLPVFDAALTVTRGRIALLGGITKSLETTQAIQIRDAEHGWLPVGSQMLEARARHTATALGDGRVLIVGGVQGTIGGNLQAIASCEVLDPFSAGSVAVDPLDEALVGHTAHKLPNGMIAVIGGEAMRLFDPSMMKWIARVELEKRRANHASLFIEGGDLLIIGGDDAGSIERIDLPDSFSVPDEPEVADDVEGGVARGGASDEIEMTTAIVATLPSPIWQCAAVAQPDGRIWVVGGLNGDGQSVPDTWFIDGLTYELIAGPTLPVEGGVAGAEAFRSGSNTIIVGGETQSGSNRSPCASAFMYESKTNRLWRLPDVPAIPAAPGAMAGTSSRRLWFLDESGRIAAEGGYRFVSPEEAQATGAKPGVYLVGERITLTIGTLPTLRD